MERSYANTTREQRIECLTEAAALLAGPAQVQYPMISPDDYVDTGFYLIPRSQFEERPVKRGRYDSVTGTITMDETGEVTAFEMPPPSQKRARRSSVKPRAEEAGEPHKGPLPQDPATHPMRAEISRLYQVERKPLKEIGWQLHLSARTVRAVLIASGVAIQPFGGDRNRRGGA